MNLSKEVLTTIEQLLIRTRTEAQDQVYRCEYQQKHVPFDHANNEMLERSNEWLDRVQAAFDAVVQARRE